MTRPWRGLHRLCCKGDLSIISQSATHVPRWKSLAAAAGTGASAAARNHVSWNRERQTAGRVCSFTRIWILHASLVWRCNPTAESVWDTFSTGGLELVGEIIIEKCPQALFICQGSLNIISAEDSSLILSTFEKDPMPLAQQVLETKGHFPNTHPVNVFFCRRLWFTFDEDSAP